MSGIQSGNIDSTALNDVYVSIGDRYWTKLSELTGDLVKDVKVGEISQQVIDVAGHYDTVRKIIDTTKTVTKTVIDPAVKTGVNIAKNTAKGAVAMDSIIDLIENVRPTTTDEKTNKKQPRKYAYDDDDIENIPISKKEYEQQER